MDFSTQLVVCPDESGKELQQMMQRFVELFRTSADILVAYCSCTLFSKVPRRAHLYITLNHVCLDSSLGIEKIRLISVSNIERTLVEVKKGNFQHCLRIKTENNKEFLLGCFTDIEEVKMFLTELWTLTVDEMEERLDPDAQLFMNRMPPDLMKYFLQTSPTTKDAFELKHKTEEFHRKFRVPTTEVVEYGKKRKKKTEKRRRENC
jgi:hypothetical protein